LNNKTKHILLPIINFDVKIEDVNYLFKNESFYGDIKKMILNNDIMDTCCMQVREHFFKTSNLEEYFINNKCAIKPLLFQVIHTLAVIQKEHEGFRHNNLLMKNIMIYLKKDDTSYVEYSGIEDSSSFYLTGANFDIKITNFENATIPRFYGLGKKSNKVLFSDKINPYYDLYIFLNDMLKSGKLSDDCNGDTKKFLERIIPPQIRGDPIKSFNKNIILYLILYPQPDFLLLMI
jgi:hypothetical protein